MTRFSHASWFSRAPMLLVALIAVLSVWPRAAAAQCITNGLPCTDSECCSGLSCSNGVCCDSTTEVGCTGIGQGTTCCPSDTFCTCLGVCCPVAQRCGGQGTGCPLCCAPGETCDCTTFPCACAAPTATETPTQRPCEPPCSFFDVFTCICPSPTPTDTSTATPTTTPTARPTRRPTRTPTNTPTPACEPGVPANPVVTGTGPNMGDAWSDLKGEANGICDTFCATRNVACTSGVCRRNGAAQTDGNPSTNCTRAAPSNCTANITKCPCMCKP